MNVDHFVLRIVTIYGNLIIYLKKHSILKIQIWKYFLKSLK